MSCTFLKIVFPLKNLLLSLTALFWCSVYRNPFDSLQLFRACCCICLCQLDSHVRARQAPAEGESLVTGVLEHHWPHGHSHLLHRDGSPSSRPTADELWEGHLLCQYHLLVHTTAWHLRSEQILGPIRHDDWQDGERECSAFHSENKKHMINMWGLRWRCFKEVWYTIDSVLMLSSFSAFYTFRWLTWCILWSSCWWCWWVLGWHGKPSLIPMKTRPGCWHATSSSCPIGWSMERCSLTKLTVRTAS